ncbi:DAK2 domain-containing protein [Kribbella capetownensis]|uniref:DAK2 domain-containing protein n=1 Tax=Kribbella capetownensis TaxID=1572659 RepID=A0A4R0JCV6_9ACTN|nr:DAK2 domain-containing protein [Kribbella capetownensis]TCC44541.1 DAK2 domain-containing protein [Kribbella capetownensis]
MEELTVEVLRAWARTALVELGRARTEIDELNVYPVPDGDTGTNLYLTWEAACDALPAGELTFAEAIQTFGRGALLGARGNSGVITSQLIRACGLRLAENLPRDQGADDNADLRMSESAAFADALKYAADAAYGAVAQPVEGTMLTVARAAATGATTAANDGKSLADVCLAAVASARQALTKTTEQLDVLRRAGVVDAGGAGLVVILGAMESVLTGQIVRVDVPARVEPQGENAESQDGPAYEVMYLLDAPDDKVADFRQILAGLGDSVVVVGGDGLWNVHVHTDDVGAAIEHGIDIGRPHRIRVIHFADQAHHEPPPGRAVIAVVAGEGLADLFQEAGAQVIIGGPGRRCSTGELLRAMEKSKAPEIVLLPNDSDSLAVAEAAATAARQDGIRVAVIPTRAQVQGLAAIAVHDPERSFDDDVVHLSAAAGQTRHGAVTIAVKDAWTMAGRCRIGDALGVVDGDFALITEDLQEAAFGVVDRLLGGGGELLTIVTGRDADPALAAALERHVRRNRKDVDVVVYDGGQDRYPLLIGVE